MRKHLKKFAVVLFAVSVMTLYGLPVCAVAGLPLLLAPLVGLLTIEVLN